ncbi:50S ribosomal protein L15 [bacterium]|nr:50S ribosomal protein L15 [bacterium]MBT4292292.1 50S ribosomal protein L15 [bacterium]MBT7310917.1 50S ribosomal protein L15 [bacterium]
MKLNNIGVPKGMTRDTKRRGRGPGSGLGKTGGRGHKGQKARSGGGIPPWFEGGQMPLNRRIPKRGFTNIFRKTYQVVNIMDLNRFDEGFEIDGAVLADAGLVKYADRRIKILGNGELETKNLNITVNKASKSAISAIEAAGGKVTVDA